MKAKYIGDISVTPFQLVDINSYHGADFETKLIAAERMVAINKNLRLFDENKEMIGEIEMNEQTASVFLIEKQKSLEVKEEALNKREQELNEREAKLSEVPESESNTKVEIISELKPEKNKGSRPKTAK